MNKFDTGDTFGQQPKRYEVTQEEHDLLQQATNARYRPESYNRVSVLENAIGIANVWGTYVTVTNPTREFVDTLDRARIIVEMALIGNPDMLSAIFQTIIESLSQNTGTPYELQEEQFFSWVLHAHRESVTTFGDMIIVLLQNRKIEELCQLLSNNGRNVIATTHSEKDIASIISVFLSINRAFIESCGLGTESLPEETARRQKLIALFATYFSQQDTEEFTNTFDQLLKCARNDNAYAIIYELFARYVQTESFSDPDRNKIQTSVYTYANVMLDILNANTYAPSSALTKALLFLMNSPFLFQHIIKRHPITDLEEFASGVLHQNFLLFISTLARFIPEALWSERGALAFMFEPDKLPFVLDELPELIRLSLYGSEISHLISQLLGSEPTIDDYLHNYELRKMYLLLCKAKEEKMVLINTVLKRRSIFAYEDNMGIIFMLCDDELMKNCIHEQKRQMKGIDNKVAAVEVQFIENFLRLTQPKRLLISQLLARKYGIKEETFTQMNFSAMQNLYVQYFMNVFKDIDHTDIQQAVEAHLRLVILINPDLTI